jgi:LytS/YehU family sensor histidine kinase
MDGVFLMKAQFYNYLLKQLNCISNMAAMENGNSNTTQKEIIKLADYVRYKFGRKEEVVQLQDEIQAVKNLISLYSSRVGDVIVYDLKLSEGSEEVYLPHYTVMTFVENSLEYAFQNKEGPWKIKMRVKEKAEGLLLTLEDNGEGFKDFRKIINGKFPDSSIFRLIQTLENYYPTQKNIVSIESNHKGTVVKIRINK